MRSKEPKRPRQGFIYLIHLLGFHKIGYSKDPEGRLRKLEYHFNLPEKPTLALVIEVHRPDLVERELHSLFRNKRIRGEWFKLTSADVLKIQNLLRLRNIGDPWADLRPLVALINRSPLRKHITVKSPNYAALKAVCARANKPVDIFKTNHPATFGVIVGGLKLS